MEASPAGTGKGIVVGSFESPHRGHQYLIDFACEYCEAATVLVYTSTGNIMPVEKRISLLRNLCPRAEYVAVERSLNPPVTDWQAWANTISANLGFEPDYLIGSMKCGKEAAEVLGVRYVPVDQGRELFPNPGPMELASQSPRQRRIAIVGAESTGKSILTKRLARHFRTVYSPEYAREHVAWQKNHVEFSDATWIARGHIASEDALARQADELLFVDTDLIMTRLYCEFIYRKVPTWITEESERRNYALTLVLDCDVDWQEDPQRTLSSDEDRCRFRDRLITEYLRHSRPWISVRGDWNERFEQASHAVAMFLKTADTPARYSRK